MTLTAISRHQSHPEPTRLALALELDPDSESGLLRTLALLHRRRCRVTRAEYLSGAGPTNRLLVELDAPPRHAHCVEAWVNALTDVRRVTSS